MKGLLAAAIAVQLVAGLVAVALDMRPVAVRTVPSEQTALRAGQTEVTGVLTYLKADHAVPSIGVAAPLRIPRGAATITGALVDGKRSSIVWDGGRPLVIEAAHVGGLVVAGAAVEIDAGGLHWLLDGAPRPFHPDSYRVLTPVAVGSSGLARPRDRVEFEADAETAIITRGGVRLDAPLFDVALILEGPGTVRMEGRLATRTPDDDEPVPTDLVTLQGSYRITLTPGIDGIAVVALFERG